MNLLKETLEVLEECNKTEQDILWVSSNDNGYFSFEEFKQLANIEYDNGYGGAEVDYSLVIVGEDFWLSRGEYDGSEWWDFNIKPTKPNAHKVPTSLLS